MTIQTSDIINSPFTIVPSPALQGFSMGFQYFDDKNTVYVSPETFRKIADGSIPNLQFVVLAWRSTDKSLYEVASDLKTRIDLYVDDQAAALN